MRKFYYSFLLIVVFISCKNQKQGVDIEIERKVDSLLNLMTLEEKIGQMNQYSAVSSPTGQVIKDPKKIDDITRGRVGSLLNCHGLEAALKYQHLAVDSSRLHIPLIFGLDIIHGYKTTFPIPLAGSCSWDMKIIENAERVAAIEATVDGVDWTFAPMVDISRDARWDRVMEGAGEDPFLGAKIAAARVLGFQGKNLGEGASLVACLKHFGAYGAPDAGREYNTVDMSELKFRNYYMLPYQAAVEASAGTVMSSYIDIFDIPSSCNFLLLRTLLKKDWNFSGFVVSDFFAINQLDAFGVAENQKEAASLSVTAGLDMDMESHSYIDNLQELVKAGIVKESLIDDAVRRILRIKFKIGLFENPYKKMDKEKANQLILCDEHLKIARETAKKSIVLLKNERQVLPLSKNIKSIALIGPLADNRRDMLGAWIVNSDPTKIVSILDGLKNKTNNKVTINYVRGCGFEDYNKDEFPKALAAANSSDVVILAMGESANMSGENQSRVYLNIPGVQEELMKEIAKTGKPIVLLLHNGRPLCINWEKKNIPAILECWFLGTQAGNAIADVLFGDYNPSGKLTMSFPAAVGQVPICYNEKRTGRTLDTTNFWRSRYRDISNDALYPFGYGLSYTTFSYSPINLKDTIMLMNDTLLVSVKVKNTGKYFGEEVVQLYISDLVASIVRPHKELKGFQKIDLKPGEEKEVQFKITHAELSFWNKNMKFVAESGAFLVMTGTDSETLQEAKFWLKEK